MNYYKNSKKDVDTFCKGCVLKKIKKFNYIVVRAKDWTNKHRPIFANCQKGNLCQGKGFKKISAIEKELYGI